MKQPLLGHKVLVTRAKNQASELSDAIRELGGEPIEFAVISMRQPSSPELLERLDAAILNLSAYQWVFFTSVNGVEFCIRRLLELGLTIQSLRGTRIAAVGPKTAEALQKHGLTVELIPQEFVSEGFVSAIRPYIQQGDRALLPTADIARTIISQQLSELGMDVTQVIAYENVPDEEIGPEIIDLLRDQEIQIVTFTSSSTVRNLLAAIRSYHDEPLDLLKNISVACIGAKTADTARELGLHVSVVAKEYTIPGLVQSLVEIALRKTLLQVQADDYQPPSNIDLFELALCMMKHIGSPDPVLRDELIYRTMANWITNDQFTVEQLRELLNISMDRDHLFYGLGEVDTDSVFTRAFSVLMIPLIINAHIRNPFLQPDEVNSVVRDTIQYLNGEKDYRGYVDTKGWAHAIAHAADALDELALVETVDHDQLVSILNVIQSKVCCSKSIYADEEDERMVTAVVSIMNRTLIHPEELSDWLDGFIICISRCDARLEKYKLESNIKLFMRSLYFRIKQLNQHKPVFHKVESILHEIGHY